MPSCRTIYILHILCKIMYNSRNFVLVSKNYKKAAKETRKPPRTPINCKLQTIADSSKNYIQIEGVASFLIKTSGLDGKIVTTDKNQNKLQNMIMTPNLPNPEAGRLE